jgi:hypothetical protein
LVVGGYTERAFFCQDSTPYATNFLDWLQAVSPMFVDVLLAVVSPISACVKTPPTMMANHLLRPYASLVLKVYCIVVADHHRLQR